MKNLKTLIKLRKHKLNQLLQHLNQTEAERDKAEEDLVQLVARMNVESQKFFGTEYGFALDEFMQDARKKRQEYLLLLITLEQKSNDLKSKIHDEFGEMKKFELALKNRIKEAIKIEDMMDIKEIDDISTMRNKREYV